MQGVPFLLLLVYASEFGGMYFVVCTSQYRVLHLVAERSLLRANKKFCPSMNFSYKSAPLIEASPKGCPRPDGPPCIQVLHECLRLNYLCKKTFHPNSGVYPFKCDRESCSSIAAQLLAEKERLKKVCAFSA